MNLAAAHIHFRIAAHLSRGVVFNRRQIAEAAAEDAVDEGLAIDFHLGGTRDGAGISAAQHAPDGEVGDANGGSVAALHTIFAIFSFDVDADAGAAHLRQTAVAAAKHAEVGVVVIGIRLSPFVGLQQFFGGHAFLQNHRGLPGAFCGRGGLVAVFVLIGADTTGEVATAIDVVGIEELAVGKEFRTIIDFLLRGWLVSRVLDVRVPDVEDALVAIPHPVPENIDGEEAVGCRHGMPLAFATVLRHNDTGVAEHIGRGDGGAADVAVATAEELAREVARKDMDGGVARHLCQIAATENVAIHAGRGTRRAHHTDVGIADDQAHLVGALRASVAVSIGLRSGTLPTAVAARKDTTADVGLAADGHVGGKARRLHDGHVAAAIDVLIEKPALDVDTRLSVNAGHVRERLHLRRALGLGIGHTIAATKDGAMEDAATDVELHVAIGLTQFLIVGRHTAVGIRREEIFRAAPTSENAVQTMELTAVDGQGGHDIALEAAAIHIAAILVRLGAALRPEASAHKTAAAGINAIDGGRLVAKVAAVDDDDRTRLARVNLRDVLGHGVVTMERHQTVFGNGIRAVEHHVPVFVPIRNVFVGRMRFGRVFAVADAVHTARSRTEDATEDAVALRVVFWQNLKRAAVDGDGAKPIERIVDLYVARVSAPRTATIKFRHDDAAVDVIIGVVLRFFGHEIDVGAAHESVARHIVKRPLIGQGQFGLRS